MFNVTDTERYSVLIFRSGAKTILQIWRNGVQPSVEIHGPGMTEVTNADGFKEIQIGGAGYLFNAPGSYAQKYALINSGSLGLLLNREEKQSCHQT